VALLLAIAIVSAIDWQLFPIYRTFSIIAALGLIGLTFLQLFGQIQKYDRKWFASRAVAESVKVQTWRFMMKVSPYDSSDASSACNQFVEDVLQMLKEQQDAKLVAGSKPVQGKEVSQFMLDQREKSIIERRDFYVKDRIDDQQNWYSKKATWNSKQYGRWTIATFGLQAGSGIIALMTFVFPGSPFNPVGVLTTLAISGISWMNARGYRELSQSYGLIAHDLSGFQSVAEEANDQGRLEKLVSNVESRISGEHTYWKARRLY